MTKNRLELSDQNMMTGFDLQASRSKTQCSTAGLSPALHNYKIDSPGVVKNIPPTSSLKFVPNLS